MKNGCVLVGGVGTGKSFTAMTYYYEKVCGGVSGTLGSMKTPKNLLIITTAKKRDSLDWEAEAIKFGIGRDQSTNVDGVKLVVDSWNNIDKYADLEGWFALFDEQRVVGNGKWVKAFIKIAKHNQWILLSATPGDTWLDYIPVFLANGFYKNRTQFKREHVIYNTYSKFPKVDRYIATGKLVRLRNQILVDMPYERHTTRHIKTIKVEYDRELYKKAVKDRWHVYEDKPIQGMAELFGVMRRVVNSDESRVRALTSLLSSHPRLIVFYNFNYELEMLRALGQELMRKHTSSGSDTTSALSKSRTQELLKQRCTNQEGFWIESPDGMGDLWIPDNLEMCDLSDLTLGELSILERELASREMGEMGARKRTPNSTPIDSMSTSQLSSGCRDSLSKHGLETQSNTEAGTAGSSFAVADEVCGFKFKGQLCVEPLPCIRHEGLSPGIPTPKAEPEATFAIAEWNGQKHEPIPDTDSWLYLVQYYAGAEGWNCIDTNAVVFYSQTYSYKQFEQAHGRIDRLNTPFEDLYYYNLVSDASIDVAIARSLKQKRSFNEREFTI